MRTFEIVAKTLAEKLENVYVCDEDAIIALIPAEVAKLGLSKSANSFILNDEDFIPDVLGELYDVYKVV